MSRVDPQPRRAGPRYVAPGAALAVAAISLVALSGWIFDVQGMRLQVPGQVTMKANTALGLLAASLALLLAAGRPGPTASTLRIACEAVLVLIGALTLSQYLFGLELTLDELLAPAPDGEYLTSAPGRMAPTTAVCFLLLAAGLALDHSRTTWARIGSRMAFGVALLIGLASLLGYAYGAPALYLVAEGVTAMSLPTALLFLVLGVGCTWLRHDRGIPAMFADPGVVGTHIRSLVPMVFGAPLLAGFAVVSGYGTLYEGRFAIALTSLASVIAAGIVAIVSIVVLRRAEAALYVRDRALNATTNGVLITDHRSADEPIIYLNDAFETLTGYSGNEIAGRNCRLLNSGVENDPATMDAIRECVREGVSGTFELKNRRKDGSIFWNRLSLAPIENHEGRITHFIGIVDDVTERREQEVRLELALADAREANAMRDTFVRLVSHELRTPLNAALTWIRLMEVDDGEETRAKGLAIVAQSIESQSRLIDDLVDVSRFASVGVKLEFEEADVREIVEATVDELRPTFEPGLGLALDVSDGDYRAQCDPLRIRQVARNLLSNAAKYTPEGGSVTVTLSRRDGNIVLEVADTGRGLSAEESRHVFEPFWRADSDQPGLGVGLAIVSALVGAHGGEVSAASAGADRGSTFTARLPAAGTTLA